MGVVVRKAYGEKSYPTKLSHGGGKTFIEYDLAYPTREIALTEDEIIHLQFTYARKKVLRVTVSLGLVEITTYRTERYYDFELWERVPFGVRRIRSEMMLR